MAGKRQREPEQRFWEKVAISNPEECWIWLASGRPYGNFWDGNRQVGAHQFALTLKLGRPLREGFCALHSCDKQLCVNPDHLFEGTNLDNSRDMVQKGRKEKGTQVYGSVINERLAVRIRVLYAKELTLEQIKEKLNLDANLGTLWHIVVGRTWKHVGGPIRTTGRSYN